MFISTVLSGVSSTWMLFDFPILFSNGNAPINVKPAGGGGEAGHRAGF